MVSGFECLFHKFSSGILRGEFIKVFCVLAMSERYLTTSLNYRWWFLNFFGGDFLKFPKKGEDESIWMNMIQRIDDS